jgi:hypothetical protein
MCKIIGISNITGLTKAQVSTLAVTARGLLSSQKDGFGFAYSTTNRQTKRHDYYVEKYTSPTDFSGIGTVGYSKKVFGKYLEVADVPMLSSGHPDKPTGPMIIHGRTATNSVNLTNTHPFRKKGWALVHNGVVDIADHIYAWEDKSVPELELLQKRYSSCDSEYLLNTYAFGKGHHDWADSLEGYAATMCISPKNEMIIAKDDRARLYMAGIPKLNNSMVFATEKHMAQALAKALGMIATPSFRMKDHRSVIIKPNGKIRMEKFEAMDTAVNMTSSANKAFGTTPSSYQPKYITDKHSYDKAKPKASYAYSNQTNQMELIPSTNG